MQWQHGRAVGKIKEQIIEKPQEKTMASFVKPPLSYKRGNPQFEYFVTVVSDVAKSMLKSLTFPVGGRICGKLNNHLRRRRSLEKFLGLAKPANVTAIAAAAASTKSSFPLV